MARMKIIDKMRKQTAVYWSTPKNDGYGNLQTAMPEEISCRWEDKQERMVDPTGEEFVSRATVYPEKALDMGGFLFLGTLTDLTSYDVSRPATIPEAFRIKVTQKIPTLSAQQTLYVAVL